MLFGGLGHNTTWWTAASQGLVDYGKARFGGRGHGAIW